MLTKSEIETLQGLVDEEIDVLQHILTEEVDLVDDLPDTTEQLETLKQLRGKLTMYGVDE